MCHKGFICNPSNCECECDKLWDAGEYLHYKNCKCRKSLIDKLVEKCPQKIDKKSYKNINIYHNGYITMKESDYVKINRLNPSYLIKDKVDGIIECNSIEEKNGNKYLTLVSKTKTKKY